MRIRKKKLIETWRKLQTSDHFYYMCTKWSNDGDVHAYFSPYQSPYDAYIAFMNALSDLQLRVSQVAAERKAKDSAKAAVTNALEVIEDTEEMGDEVVSASDRPKQIESVLAATVKRWRQRISGVLSFFRRG